MKKLILLIIVICLISGGCTEYKNITVTETTTHPPVTIQDPPLIITQPPVTEIKTVLKTETFTRTLYPSPCDLRKFGSYGDLTDWLDSIRVEIKEARSPDWNCTNYAWWLVERAMKDGYLMIYHGISAEAYNSSFTDLQLDGAHAITATYINGHTYLIEPQNLEVFPNYDIE